MQSKRQSLTEVCVSIAIGFVMAVVAQMLLAHLYAKPFTFRENLEWTGYFTALAIVRGYLMRRFFNWLWR